MAIKQNTTDLQEILETANNLPTATGGLEWQSVYSGTCDLTPGMWSAGSNVSIDTFGFDPIPGKLYCAKIQAINCTFENHGNGGISFADGQADAINGYQDTMPCYFYGDPSFYNFTMNRIPVIDNTHINIYFICPPGWNTQNRSYRIIAPYILEENPGQGTVEIFEASISAPQ